MKKLLLTFTLIVGVLFTVAWTQHTRPQWEYKFEYNISEKKANSLGADGWELVAVGAPGSGLASNVETYVFKRAK